MIDEEYNVLADTLLVFEHLVSTSNTPTQEEDYMPKQSLRHRLKMAQEEGQRLHQIIAMILEQEGQITLTDETIKNAIANRSLFEHIPLDTGLLLRIVRRK